MTRKARRSLKYKDYKHHWIVEHIWRALRAGLLVSASALWLYTDHIHTVMVLIVLATIVDQLHGLICYLIQKMLHWNTNFKLWE